MSVLWITAVDAQFWPYIRRSVLGAEIQGTVSATMTTPIPSPPSVPFLGHTQSIDSDVPILSYQLLSKQYGEIFELNLAGLLYIYFYGLDAVLTVSQGRHVTIICTQELLHEVSDEKRFRKVLSPSLNEVRNAAGDGLFTVCIAQMPHGHDTNVGVDRPTSRNRTGGLHVSPPSLGLGLLALLTP